MAANSHAHLLHRRGLRVLEHDIVVPGLDPAHEGVKIAHVTDLHVGLLTPTKRILRAFEIAAAAHPDLLFMTGDFVCYSPKFVGRLGELTKNLANHIPTYAVLGNHDYWTDGEGVRKALEHNGIGVLRNRHSEITLRHAALSVIGVDDAVTKQDDVGRAFRGVRKQRSQIVLTHTPMIGDEIGDHARGLVLAGHTHGGHINIPHVTARIAERFGFGRYLVGFYQIGGSLLYVNCGIGSSSVPIRANAPPEVAILTLRTGMK